MVFKKEKLLHSDLYEHRYFGHLKAPYLKDRGENFEVEEKEQSERKFRFGQLFLGAKISV